MEIVGKQTSRTENDSTFVVEYNNKFVKQVSHDTYYIHARNLNYEQSEFGGKDLYNAFRLSIFKDATNFDFYFFYYDDIMKEDCIKGQTKEQIVVYVFHRDPLFMSGFDNNNFIRTKIVGFGIKYNY